MKSIFSAWLLGAAFASVTASADLKCPAGVEGSPAEAYATSRDLLKRLREAKCL